MCRAGVRNNGFNIYLKLQEIPIDMLKVQLNEPMVNRFR